MSFLKDMIKKFAVRSVSFEKRSDGSGESKTNNYTFYTREYQCGLIFNAVARIADEIIKMSPQHIVKKDGNSQYVYDNIQDMLDWPNEDMTLTDFLYFISYQLLITCNVYILKKFNEKAEIVGLYPIAPNSVEQVRKNGVKYYKMRFNDPNLSDEYLLPDYSVIHIKYKVTRQNSVGGTGAANNSDLLYFANAHRALSENLKIATQLMPSMMLSFGALNEGDDYREIANNVLATIKEQGIVYEDPRFEIKDGIDMKANREVDIETLKYFEQVVCSHFGINSDILNGTATAEQHEQFFNAVIRPLVKVLSEAFSTSIFTPIQYRKGHRIQFLDNDLSLMNIDQKTHWLEVIKDVGVVTRDQILHTFGLPSLQEGGDRVMMSLNFIDSAIATEYQLGRKGLEQQQEQKPSKPAEQTAPVEEKESDDDVKTD